MSKLVDENGFKIDYIQHLPFINHNFLRSNYRGKIYITGEYDGKDRVIIEGKKGDGELVYRRPLEAEGIKNLGKSLILDNICLPEIIEAAGPDNSITRLEFRTDREHAYATFRLKSLKNLKSDDQIEYPTSTFRINNF